MAIAMVQLMEKHKCPSVFHYPCMPTYHSRNFICLILTELHAVRSSHARKRSLAYTL